MSCAHARTKLLLYYCISVLIRLRFVVFCRRLACDQRVLVFLKSRTLGSSFAQLYNTLREQHSESWMRRAIHYLGVCEEFLALDTVRRHFPPPPPMPPVPQPVWLLTAYSFDLLTRLEEYKARITSTFGSVLKMDSTRKVSNILQFLSDFYSW